MSGSDQTPLSACVTNLKNAQFYLERLEKNKFHGCTISLKAELRRTLPMLEVMLAREGEGGEQQRTG